MQLYWQAKIWGLLHDPVFKALHNNTGRGDNSFWERLPVMAKWTDDSWNPETSGRTVPKHIHLADYIASASDRGSIGSVTNAINYNHDGLEIRHLLSGAKLNWKTNKHPEVVKPNRKDYLQGKESELFNKIPPEILNDEQALFWWLWRCLPTAATRLLEDESLILMPAETRLPDSSIWSHGSITAALAGALAGYDLSEEQIEERWSDKKYTLSHPHLVTFSFSPVQELIKASRKMRDFWAGSWILHYISARVSWKLACKYGPDTLLYPSLYQQPLIDKWLLAKYEGLNFNQDEYIKSPTDASLLTAGFPNVLVLVLPQGEVKKAMQTANQELKETWRELSTKVFHHLPESWRRELSAEANTWDGWLDNQWQTYWTAMPIGVVGEDLKNPNIPVENHQELDKWVNTLNTTYGISPDSKRKLFQDAEIEFLRHAYQERFTKQGRRFSVNVGSWWGDIFDATRINLTAVKNARNWQIPNAFSTRSTISGIGAAVYPTHGNDWATEGEVREFWQERGGLFDGREQLNATEVVKRGLHKVLPHLLDLETSKLAAAYPDLSAGVAGYLKTNGEVERKHYLDACQEIKDTIELERDRDDYKWGIPWAEQDKILKKHHPRLLNAGWLVEDIEGINSDRDRAEKRSELQSIIDNLYPQNNPTDWYVLAAGDGDGMSEWLKGIKLDEYGEYVPEPIKNNDNLVLQKFLEVKKRMGPSTHNALSRALLDFSNQLVPYLTQERYAGRLIYGGGDDVLAYTNLWEWDSWLWDIRQCFRGDEDPQKEFKNQGDYWQWNSLEPRPQSIAERPLFTMGNKASISFGIVIAHQSVPLAIALENLWAAEDAAKEHQSIDEIRQDETDKSKYKKDAVQVRVMYGNGNTLSATSKFLVFDTWRQLLTKSKELKLDAAIFEQAATIWTQHPAPNMDAIESWCRAFCSRRDALTDENCEEFRPVLSEFIRTLSAHTRSTQIDDEINHWLKLSAFILRRRKIKIPLPQPTT
jgi:CRISPR-associated protein Cmr2